MNGRCPEALIFDFDGVIVDSVQLKVDAFLEMYQGHGEEILQAVEHYQRYHGGISRSRKFEYFEETLLGNPADEDRIAELSERYSRLVEDKVASCPAVDGAVEFLNGKGQDLPCYVISGTPQQELTRIADRRGLSDHFRKMLGFPTTKEQGIEQFLADGPYDRTRVVMIGDAMTDHDAAQATGVGFVGVAPPDVPHFFPDGTILVEDLTGLPQALGL